MRELAAQSQFFSISAILVIASLVGLIGHLLRQTLIVSFTIVGILVGPAMLGIARSSADFGFLSELGVAVLLFLVGLKLDLDLVRSIGPVALIAGLGQVATTAAVGALACWGAGLDATTSLYLSVALSFSSTVIVVKLLSDKRETETLHGQVALGVLIVQDVLVIFAMVALSAVGIGTQAGGSSDDVLQRLVLATIALLGVAVFVRVLARPLIELLVHARELLLVFSIAQAALFAGLGDTLGLGKELGGLLAGVSLASTHYRDAIAARLTPVRDFLLLFFFVSIGARFEPAHITANIGTGLALLVLVLVGKPLIVVALMGAMGFRRRTGFLTGLTLAQISEFSLIFMAMGVALGHVQAAALGLLTVVGLVTIAVSTYAISHSHEFYAVIEPFLEAFERQNPWRERRVVEHAVVDHPYDVIVLGMGRFGNAIARRLERSGLNVLGVDFSPAAVHSWRKHGGEAHYGDVSDPDLVTGLPLRGTRWIVCAVTEPAPSMCDVEPRLALVHALKHAGYQGRIAVATADEGLAGRLTSAGVDLVLDPFQDAADRAVELLVTGEAPERISTADPQGQRDIKA